MTNQSRQNPEFIYTYASSEEEESLCLLEIRMLFGQKAHMPIFKSNIEIDPSRSPFIKERIQIIYEAETLEDLYEQLSQLEEQSRSFKVLFVKRNDLKKESQIDFHNRRRIEREIGQRIKGIPDLDCPQQIFGVITLNGKWYLGLYQKNNPVWMNHMKKPREYSTALSTRMARAIVNIAVPSPSGVRVIDPCCGIGTVLVEALSMGINIVGRDVNPIVCRGSRENIAHFGFHCEVTKGKIEDILEHYDVAIVDLPYNLCTTATPDEQLSIIKSAKRIADRVVIVTSEPIDGMLEEADLEVLDSCKAKKGNFQRQILVCE